MPYRAVFPYFYRLDQYENVLPSGAIGTSLTAARAEYNSAYTAFIQARDARDQALATWQSSDDWEADLALSNDACGKKVSSCKLRFVDTHGESTDGSLPFGSYPGIGSILA